MSKKKYYIKTEYALRICPYCKEEFMPKTSRQICCSKEKCRKERKSEISREWQKNKPKEIKEEVKVYVLKCLKCEKPFKSWDKVYNRICSKCREQNKDIAKSHSEESFLIAVND